MWNSSMWYYMLRESLAHHLRIVSVWLCSSSDTWIIEMYIQGFHKTMKPWKSYMALSPWFLYHGMMEMHPHYAETTHICPWCPVSMDAEDWHLKERGWILLLLDFIQISKRTSQFDGRPLVESQRVKEDQIMSWMKLIIPTIYPLKLNLLCNSVHSPILNRSC